MTEAAAVVAVLLGALAQSVSGIGFSLVCGPFLVAVLGPADGVRLGIALAALLVLGLPEVSRGLLAASAAALAVGLVAGGPLSRRVSERLARATTLGLAGTGGLVVLVRAAA